LLIAESDGAIADGLQGMPPRKTPKTRENAKLVKPKAAVHHSVADMLSWSLASVASVLACQESAVRRILLPGVQERQKRFRSRFLGGRDGMF